MRNKLFNAVWIEQLVVSFSQGGLSLLVKPNDKFIDGGKNHHIASVAERPSSGVRGAPASSKSQERIMPRRLL